MTDRLSNVVQEAVAQLYPYFLARFGQGVIAGNVLPDETGVRDLGSADKQLGTIYAQNIKADILEVSKSFAEGVGPNLLRNGSFEQKEDKFTNQPRYWVLANEVSLGASLESG